MTSAPALRAAASNAAMRAVVSAADGTAVGPSRRPICASITSSAETGAEARSTRTDCRIVALSATLFPRDLSRLTP
jgi:hypothetical protein